jgi:AraC-like DNA-binding protein
VHGCDLLGRSYVICVEYDKTPAPLTLYYTDPLPDAGTPMIVLTDDGDLMIVGGYNYNKGHGGKLENDNFSPLASVYLLHLGNQSAVVSDNRLADWWWVLLIVAVLAVVAIIFLTRKRQYKPESVVSDSASNDKLMHNICALMESQKLYLNSDLKLNDVADALNTNRNVISSCINNQRGCSFSQFVGGYRIDHAKDLMRSQPDIKVSEVWMASGFSTETSFFRTFKAVTGMTPNEFKQKND